MDKVGNRLGIFVALAVLLGAFGSQCFAQDNGAEELAKQIREATGVTGGFIIHIGCTDGRLTAALHASDSYIVHGLARRAADVERARDYIAARGLYGQVSVDLLSGERLPYVDGIATLVVSEGLGNVPMSEVRRVVAPEGVAYIRAGGDWEKYVKPRPDEIDTWTHFFHDSTGNPVAHDEQIGPPRGLKWAGSPRWSRHHDHMASTSAMACSGKRMFYIFDEGSTASVILPSHWKLIARDAFNGTILWKRDIESWQPHLYPFKSGPAQVTRRLVATDDRVYVTLGFEHPLSVLDAATGETIRTPQNTRATEEIICSDGVVFALVSPTPVPWEKFAPESNNCGVEKKRVEKNWNWNEKPRDIVAIDTETGDELWRKSAPVAPMTLAADGERVVYHNGEHLVCLSHDSGEVLWNSEPLSSDRRIPTKTSHRVILYGDYILFAGVDNRIRGLSAATGEILWTAPHPPSGHNSMEDLMILQGLVWAGKIAGGGHSGLLTGRDLATGEAKKEFTPDVETYWFHHRCYPSKATDRYIMTSRTGIEFIDPRKEHWGINHWVRGGCLYGILPANGMVYVPPHDCACYPEAKLFGFRALSADPTRPRLPSGDIKPRLEKGPVYDEPVAGASAAPADGDWPTFRHDGARSGYTPTPVPAGLAESWGAEFDGRITSPVVAGGKVYVAAVDRHTLYALDEETGDIAWQYTAGGRIDSPPTIYHGRAIFGSRDGYVYCLRAADGQLLWRFRAAPRDVRLMAFEQVESVWPVHGSVLVHDGRVYCVAGRCMFLDEGLRLLQLDAETGGKLAESVLDERDPETGGNLQDRIQGLQMPVALPDILSTDGEKLYMRSQRFDFTGEREEIGPHAGSFKEQAIVQAGPGKHLFAPMGFLDGSWFHRSYWVYGKSFAGGWGGYYQAGKYAPFGRILAVDDTSVYGYGRIPQYLRWTSPLEYQLFATTRDFPDVSDQVDTDDGPVVDVAKSASLNPAKEPLTVEAWAKATKKDGAVVARGGSSHGYALLLRGGRPTFTVRVGGEIFSVAGKEGVVGEWTHLAGVLTEDKDLQIYVNGELAGSAPSGGFIVQDPNEAMQIGADVGSTVGDYESPFRFRGSIDEVRIYEGALSAEQIRGLYEHPEASAGEGAKVVLYYPFDGGKAEDKSGNDNDGTATDVEKAEGKVGDGIAIGPEEVLPVVRVEKSASLNPANRALSVEAWVRAARPEGVILARGGGTQGYALLLQGGKPQFAVRSDQELFSVTADEDVFGEWTHVAGVLTADEKLQVYVNGELAGTSDAAFIAGDPTEEMQMGADEKTTVGVYEGPLGFGGVIDEVRVYDGALTAAQVRSHAEDAAESAAEGAELVLQYSFDDGRAIDGSGKGNDGTVVGIEVAEGRSGDGVSFPVSDDLGTVVRVDKSESLNPAQEALTVEAWVNVKEDIMCRQSGAVVARGGSSHGYALVLKSGHPRFVVRIDGQVAGVTADRRIEAEWTHLAGVLTEDKQLRVYVNGRLEGSERAPGLIVEDPSQAMEIAADEGGGVGDYQSPFGFEGLIDDVRIYEGALSDAQIRQSYDSPGQPVGGDAKLVLHYTFDNGLARDVSGNGNHGLVVNGESAAGRIGRALKSTARKPSNVQQPIQYAWRTEQPGLIVRGMTVADEILFVAGPPDVLDEEEAFKAAYDPKIQVRLREQEAALEGRGGAMLWAVSKSTGEKLTELRLGSPPAFDGMAAANGRLYMATMDDRLICFSGQ